MTEAVQQPTEAVPPPGGRRILIVDDSLGSARILSLLISHLGPHEVQMAHDGVEALEVAEQFKPDLLLLDLTLPRMNGLEVARRLRENEDFQNALLVALTGHAQEEYREKSKAAGFDEYLVKPVGMETIKRLLNLPHQGSGSSSL